MAKPYRRGVIDVPTPWTDELLKIAVRLETRAKQTRWTDRTDYLIERDFVVSAYVMRKLLESDKASAETSRRRIPVRRFNSSGRLPAADIGDAYSLQCSRRDTLSIAELCDEVLHNSAFTFCCGETNDLFDGVYVTADRERKHVYLVLASDFIALCEDVANSTITQSI